MKKLLFLVTILMISSVLAVENLGTFKINDCIELIQTCSNCSYVNVTSVKYPNSVQALGNVAMTKNGTLYTYNFCSANFSGTYIVSGVGDVDGLDSVFAYTFEVTTTGMDSIFIFLIIFLVIIVGVLTFGIKLEDYWITMFGGILVILFGFFVIIYGIDVMKDTMTTWAIGIIIWGIGIYIILKSAIEQLKLGG